MKTKICLSENQKKGLIAALILSLSINAVLFFSILTPAMAVPFSSYVITEPSTEPVNVLYCILFAFVILGVAILASIELSTTKNITSMASVGAIIAVVSCIYLAFLSPISPFIAVPPTYAPLDLGVGNVGTEVTCYLTVSGQVVDFGTGTQYCKTTNGHCYAASVRNAAQYEGWCSCLSSVQKSMSGRTLATCVDCGHSNRPDVWKIFISASLTCAGCPSGQTRCSGNTVQTCSNNVWVNTQSCGESSQCVETGGAHCANGCTAGNKCKDSQNYGYQNADCTWNYPLTYCGGGCTNGNCNSGCSSGYKCKDATTRGYQNADCTWTGLRNCPGGCIDDVCYSLDTTTTTVTTTRTTTTRTTTPPTPTTPTPTGQTPTPTTPTPTGQTTTTTIGVCTPYTQACQDGWINLCASDGMSWIRSNQPCGTTVTTIPPTCQAGATQNCLTMDNKVGIQTCDAYGRWGYCVPTNPPIDYLLYGLIGLVIIALLAAVFMYSQKKKK